MPVGNWPVSLNVGGGDPVAVKEKVPWELTVKVVLVPLVNMGATPTVSA